MCYIQLAIFSHVHGCRCATVTGLLSTARIGTAPVPQRARPYTLPFVLERFRSRTICKIADEWLRSASKSQLSVQFQAQCPCCRHLRPQVLTLCRTTCPCRDGPARLTLYSRLRLTHRHAVHCNTDALSAAAWLHLAHMMLRALAQICKCRHVLGFRLLWMLT